jgi:hypothetical protein
MARNDTVAPPVEKGNQVEVDQTPPEFSLEQFLASLKPPEREGWTIRELVEQSPLPQKLIHRKRDGDRKEVISPSGVRATVQDYRPKASET